MTLPIRNKISVFVQRRLQVERRSQRRIVPVQRTLCLLQAPGQSAQSTTVVQNLSRKGIGVLVDQEHPPGTVLTALLVNSSHTFAVKRELKVVRCFRVNGEQFFLAGPFGQLLAHEEMVPFII
jgi:hypothetical protein